MAFIDFQEIKELFTISDVAQMLNLTLVERNNQRRGPCPHCNQGGDRALVITPDKNAAYCFAEKRGGDMIWLASHVLGVPVRDAAVFIAEHTDYPQDPPEPPPAPPQAPVQATPQVPSTVPPKTPEEGETVLRPLGSLVAELETVQKYLTVADAQAIGAGYCKKGLMRGHIAFPLRTEAGKLVGYVGYNPETKELKLPKGLRL